MDGLKLKGREQRRLPEMSTSPYMPLTRRKGTRSEPWWCQSILIIACLGIG
jgi:hypothetical protein